MLKTLYIRRCRRIAQGKRMTDLDERYFRSAEDNLCAELSVSLGVPGRMWRPILRSVFRKNEKQLIKGKAGYAWLPFSYEYMQPLIQ